MKRAREEERQVLDERLVVVGAIGIRRRHVRLGQHHRRRGAAHTHGDGGGHLGEQGLEVAVVRRADVTRQRLVCERTGGRRRRRR